MPIPTSLIMLAGGAFAASGDLRLTMISVAAFLGASSGDQAGYALGRWGRQTIDHFTAGNLQRQALVDRARAFTLRWHGPGIFLSRWLISPLGPYVNFVSGASQVKWVIFTGWSLFGEAIWVAIYVGLGYFFADQIKVLYDILSNLSGVMAAGLTAVLLGIFLWNRLQEIDANGKNT